MHQADDADSEEQSLPQGLDLAIGVWADNQHRLT